MQRLKVYDVPHKALRNALGQISLLAGNTSYENPKEVEILYRQALEFFGMLHTHAQDENDYTLAHLEAKAPGASKHDVQDHIRIEASQKKLEDLLGSIYKHSNTDFSTANSGDEFYLAFSEFQSAYLAHISEEERVTQPLIWLNFTDEELMEQRKQIIAKMTPEKLMLWLKYAVPAQNHAERLGFLGGLKKSAPPPFFQQVWALVTDLLTPSEIANLEKDLNNGNI